MVAGYQIAIVNSSSFGRIFPQHIERLERLGEITRLELESTLQGAELAERLQGFDMIIAGVTPFYTRAFFEAASGLKLLSRHGIGYNNVDTAAAKKAGVIVSIVSPLIERDAVAENAIANLMAMMRKTVPAQAAALDGRWKERASFVGHNITGKTAGVIGCGNIGSRVAEIFKHGFGTRLLACDPQMDMAWAKQHGIEAVDLDTLLQEADIISLNAALNDSSFHLLNAAAFAKMKQGVYITNTARGDLIDEQALLKAIDDGTVAALATDVMHEEPAPDDHPYFTRDNILVTPHTSAYTYECLEGMGDKCVTDVERVARGEVPDCVVS